MKTILLSLAIICANIATSKEEITLNIKGINNNDGNILVMASSKSLKNPIMKLEKATKDGVEIKIVIPDNVEELEFSIMHDENSNYKMDMTEQGVPMEGYALKKININEDSSEYTIRLTYPNIN